jgi:PadR family transcriptional regulator PadR
MALIAESSDVFENLRLELRRGCLILAVMASLKAEQYGYTLRKILADHGLAVDEGTLYPLLRRLESQGLLLSEWREADKRNKRFYRLSPEGEQTLQQLAAEWRSINGALDTMLGDTAHARISDRTILDIEEEVHS